jgi:hypothetical protein
VYDAVIVGGGLSGLVSEHNGHNILPTSLRMCCNIITWPAWLSQVAGQALAAKHGQSNFLITEARDRVGGNITSMERDGFIWEEGPNSFQPTDAMLQIAVRRIVVCRGSSSGASVVCKSACITTGGSGM